MAERWLAMNENGGRDKDRRVFACVDATSAYRRWHFSPCRVTASTFLSRDEATGAAEGCAETMGGDWVPIRYDDAAPVAAKP